MAVTASCFYLPLALKSLGLAPKRRRKRVEK
jgi:hypothetical protein